MKDDARAAMEKYKKNKMLLDLYEKIKNQSVDNQFTNKLIKIFDEININNTRKEIQGRVDG